MSSQPTEEELKATAREPEERFVQFCRMTDEMLRGMSPAQRDRMLQVHLAAARGSHRNFRLFCRMTDELAPMRRQRLTGSGERPMGDPSIFALVSRLSKDLELEGIPNALTGSVANAVHGEPVASLDVDIAVEMTPASASRIAKRWERELSADEYSFQQAAIQHGIATLLHLPSGLKIDLSVVPDKPYYREMMRRRVWFLPPEAPDGFWVVTAEDLVLMKLLWHQQTPSEKQWRNGVDVVRIKGRALDWTYLRHWAGELKLEEDLKELVREAGL